MKLLAVAVGALLVGGGAVAVHLLSRQAPAPAAPAYSLDEYAVDIQRALAAFERFDAERLAGPESAKVSLEEARSTLQEAQRRLPQQGLAGLLDRAMALHARLGTDYKVFPHDDAYAAWESVRKFRGLDPETQVFVTRRQKWMDAENAALLALETGRRLVAEGKREEAVLEFRKAPEGTLAYRDAQLAIQALRQADFAALAAEAERLIERREWDKALNALARAIEGASNQTEKAALQARVDFVRGRVEEDALFREAQQAHRNRRYEEAKQLLARLPHGGTYAAQAEAILVDISRREALGQVYDLFAEGKGDEALVRLEALEGADPRVVGPMRDLLTRVLAAVKTAEQHEAAQRHLEALGAWRDVQALLQEATYRDNAYRRRATQFLDQWNEAAISDLFFAKAKEAVTADNLAEARALLEQARRAKPGVAMGEEEVMKPILRRVSKMKLQAFDARRTNDKAQAVAILKQALAMLRPGDGDRGSAYESVAKELRELGAAP